MIIVDRTTSRSMRNRSQRSRFNSRKVPQSRYLGASTLPRPELHIGAYH